MFFVLRHHFVPRHFYPEVRRKNPESRRKKTELGGILFETFFCTKQHDKTMQKIIFLGPMHLFWESAEINAYRQVRHFFLPRGVCRYADTNFTCSLRICRLCSYHIRFTVRRGDDRVTQAVTTRMR